MLEYVGCEGLEDEDDDAWEDLEVDFDEVRDELAFVDDAAEGGEEVAEGEELEEGGPRL